MPEAMSPHTFYATPSPVTDPGAYTHLLDGLPRDIPSLVKVVQGVLLHIFWAERYGVTLSDEREAEVNLRRVEAQLARMIELDASPLSVARPLERKLVGNCRDFSVLLTAILRHQGVPARARCGFGAYFWPGHYEDHWVAEYWNADEKRWVMVDAQIDELQARTLKPSFDTLPAPFNPLDVRRDQFILGGRAWQMARHEGHDPKAFGIFDMNGLAFIRGDLIRDFMALNKVEILPWDDWPLIAHSDEAAATQDIEIIERIAALTQAGDEAFPEIRAICESEHMVRPAH